MSKFIRGDLVTLSAYGRKAKQNHPVYGRIGIIVKICGSSDYPITIKWLGATIGHAKGDTLPMKEYEIKFAKHGVVEETLC